MSIIDTTYFRGRINLPTDNANYTNKLQIYIDEAQRYYLEKLFGYELYALFIAELPIPTSARFTKILDGSTYEDAQGYTQYWPGLANSDKNSFLAYFAYYEYDRASLINETGHGTTKQQFENSKLIIPSQKQSESYNYGVDGYRKLYDFMISNEDDYPEWVYTELEYLNVLGI